MRTFSRIGIPSPRSLAAKMAIAMVVWSVVSKLLMDGAGIVFLLVPKMVFGLELWQPFTWLLIGTNPLSILFGALIIWSIGGALEATWGPKRLLAFSFFTTFFAGLATLAVAGLFGLGNAAFAGATVLSGVLWVSYGLLMGKGQLNFWGIPLSGNAFAAIGVVFVLLDAIFGSWVSVIPEAFALAFAFGYVKWGSPRLLFLKFQSWRLQRDLKSRSKHLKLVDDGRNMPRDSDRYLH